MYTGNLSTINIGKNVSIKKLNSRQNSFTEG